MEDSTRKALARMLRQYFISEEVRGLAGKIEENEPLPELSGELFSQFVSLAHFDNLHKRFLGLQDAEHPACPSDVARKLEQDQILAAQYLFMLLESGLPISEAQGEQMVSSAVEQIREAADEERRVGKTNHPSSARIFAAGMHVRKAFIPAIMRAAPQLSAEQIEKAFSILKTQDKLNLIESYVDNGGLADPKTMKLFQSTLSSILQDPEGTRDSRVNAFRIRKKLEAAKPKAANSSPPRRELPLKPLGKMKH